MQSEPQHHATQPAGAALAPPVMQAPHVQSHFASPSPHVPPQVQHYMMSPPAHLTSMMSPPAHQSNVRGMAAASPQVDCWGMQGWIVNPCAAAAQGLTAAAQGYAPVQMQNFQTAAQRCASMHPALPAYEALLVRELGHLQGCCSAFGEPLTAYGQAIGVAMNAQRDMIAKALAMRRPESAEGMRSLLAPTEAALTHLELLKTRSCDDRSDLKNHLQMLCGACSALGWVTTTDPKAYVSDALNAVPVFARKIQEAAGADADACEALVAAVKTLLRALRDHVAKYHSKGLTFFEKINSQEGGLSTDTEKHQYAGKEMVSDFDSILREKVVPVVETCYRRDLGGDLIVAADCMQRAFKAQRDMLVLASKHAPPPEDVLERVLEPTSAVLGELAELEEECENKRLAHHVKLVTNGMSGLAWVSVEHPVVYMSEVVMSLPVFSDKIEKNAPPLPDLADGETCPHRELVHRFKTLMRALLEYVKTRHPKGLSWNPDGKTLA